MWNHDGIGASPIALRARVRLTLSGVGRFRAKAQRASSLRHPGAGRDPAAQSLEPYAPVWAGEPKFGLARTSARARHRPC